MPYIISRVEYFKTMKNQKSNFKSIGKLIEPLVTRNGQANTISLSKLLSIWNTIVGEEISRKASPIRMKTIEGGKKNILYLGMTGPYMAELSLQIQDIIGRVNSYYAKELIVKIKLQRLHDINNKNVLELDNKHDFRSTKNEGNKEPKLATVQLEHALTKMKNNLSNSRKKNEIMED